MNNKRDFTVESNYTLDKKKDDIKKLKTCAQIYKDNLLGKRFLIIFDNCEYVEIIFTKSQFKHLTGISSTLSANKFYEMCIGKKMKNHLVYIKPDDIFTTVEHPRIFALKKFSVFSNIFNLFKESSYILSDITENTRFYKIGLANIELTLFFDNDKNLYIPISLKSDSHIKNAKKFSKIDYVFEKTNPYFKYQKIIFPKNIDLNYFLDNRDLLDKIIDFESLYIN